jgi:hypothetical protein
MEHRVDFPGAFRADPLDGFNLLDGCDSDIGRGAERIQQYLSFLRPDVRYRLEEQDLPSSVTSDLEPATPGRPNFSPPELIRRIENEVSRLLGRLRSENGQPEDQGHRNERTLKCRLRDGEVRVAIGVSFENQAGTHLPLSRESSDLCEQTTVANRQRKVSERLSLDDECVIYLVVSEV